MSESCSVRNLSFRYRSYPGLEGEQLFDNISFDIPEGKISFFLALPGSGKTTLSRILASLVPAYTGGDLSGTVKINGEAGIVFQDPDEQIFCDTAEKELAFPLECRGTEPEIIEKKITEALELTGISHLRYNNPAGFSGGEKRRLMLAALCCTDPSLWILDEPLEEIDIFGKREILDFLSRRKKSIIIFTSKLPDLYLEYGSCFFVYHKGVLDRYDDPQDSRLKAALGEKGFLPDIPPKKRRETKPGAQYILEMKNIRYSYPESEFTLEAESFFLEKGRITALIGTNGCGKSTLSRIAAGLITPDSGELLLNGRKAEASLLNRSTSYLFQNPDCQFFLPTAREELAYGLKLMKLPEEEIKLRCDRAAELFGIRYPDAPPSLMSYGERKKLQAAVYFLLNKEIVIIDEADSGVSFREFRQMLENLRSSAAAPAILVITHDLRLASTFADYIYYMKNGRFADIPPELGL